ncbi:MAG: EAL domain-containing protein [Acidobacteria bacterium]|nr:EAL domain-containing protein [Acidobacteriota bacterium]MBV9478742.1 EAL domain-containing protein [Acidobacteriota bacterium]
MSESALNRILQPGGITPVYQPLFRAAGATIRMHGLECLSRGPRGTNFESANVLFEYVRLKREESLVDRACVAAALRGASSLPQGLALTINVHASTLGRDHAFLPFLTSTAAATGIELSRVTVDIVEHAPPWDGVSFLAAIAQLRDLGATIALDDVGLGQSNFKMLLDVKPDYLKLDRYFVESCAHDRERRAVIAALQQLAREFHAELVAEGVTTKEDAETLQQLGITLMQGFFFAEPLTLEQAQAFFRG